MGGANRRGTWGLGGDLVNMHEIAWYQAGNAKISLPWEGPPIASPSCFDFRPSDFVLSLLFRPSWLPCNWLPQKKTWTILACALLLHPPLPPRRVFDDHHDRDKNFPWIWVETFFCAHCTPPPHPTKGVFDNRQRKKFRTLIWPRIITPFEKSWARLWHVEYEQFFSPPPREFSMSDDLRPRKISGLEFDFDADEHPL